jgi:hypothetical protein
MQPLYYIDDNGRKDGPHDLITVMRRIRMKKISADTPIYIDDAPAMPAGQIPDIALFFTQDTAPKEKAADSFSLYQSIMNGWRFTFEHNVMTVYAGGLLLISFILGAGLVKLFGLVTGGILGWGLFVTLHNMYLLFVLRFWRGQTPGSDFINQQIAPVLGTLLLACIVLALMMAGGWLLLVIPGVVVTVFYVFVPFLILDRRYSLVEAMNASRLLLFKRGNHYAELTACLVILHFICLLLIIPLPLTLPVFAAAIAQIYEELSAA